MKKLFTALFVFAVVGLFAQAKVYTPALNAPAAEAVDQMPDVVLSWDAVPGSAELFYTVQIDLDDTFSNPVEQEVSLMTGWAPELLIFGQTYFWRVMASDPADNTVSDWSEVRSFTVFSQLGLSSPSNGAEDRDVVLDLKWRTKVGQESISGFQTVEIQYDTSANFDSPLLNSGTAELETATAVVSIPLEYGDTYYWRARAIHDLAVSEWSEMRDFTTIAAVELDKPVNNTENTGFIVELEWDKIEGTLLYEYIYDTDPDFGAPYRFTTVQDTAATSDLTYGQTYYWKVRAMHQNDTSAFSEVFAFTTVDSPILSQPADGATDIGISLTEMSWVHAEGIENYNLQYALDANFSDQLVDFIGVDTSSVYNASVNLLKDTTYFWRVRYIHSSRYDTSLWSPTWSFKTITGSPDPGGIEENELSASMQIFPNPVNNNLNVTFEVASAMKSEVAIYSVTGQKVAELNTQLSSGNNLVSIDVSDLANGVYILHVNAEGTLATRKFVVKQ